MHVKNIGPLVPSFMLRVVSIVLGLALGVFPLAAQSAGPYVFHEVIDDAAVKGALPAKPSTVHSGRRRARATPGKPRAVLRGRG